MISASYLARRLGHAVFVVWATFTVSFVLLYLLPSDPVSLMLQARTGDQGVATADPAQRAQIAAELGLDKPVPVQYALRLFDAVRGDLGTSVQSGEPVTTRILAALPATLQLASAALLLALAGAVVVGFAATMPRAGYVRRVVESLPPLGLAIAPFWVGLMLLQIFSFRLPWFPAMGTGGLSHLVLPAVTLALPTGAALAQLLVQGIGDTLREPFVQTALTKGIGRYRLFGVHVFRNSALPLLTMTGLVVGNLLAGSIVTETVFSRDGLGTVTQQAVEMQDIPVVQGVVILSAAIFAVVNLAVDLVYPVVDPRIARPVLSEGE